MTYTLDTSLDSAPQGGWTADDWYRAGVSRGAKRLDDLRQYLTVVYSQTFLNAEVVAAQSALETGFWTSYWYEFRLNMAGIGITGDTVQDNASRVWATGTAAARAHLAHLGLYHYGPRLPAGFPAGPADDPRWLPAIAAGYAGTVHTISGLTNRWAMDDRYGDKLVAILNERLPPGTEGTGPMALTFGRVPHPGYVDLQSTTADKPEGFGWDNLGKRNPVGIALHRMWGTLAGTDSVFADPAVGSLTDYGLGSANIDGAALDGIIHKYNDPLGYRSGWASGRVSAPYGDGLAFVNKYGINAVNRDLVSIETPGWDIEPITDFAWGELVALVAYWADFCKVPYTSLPLNPHTGINFIIWHQEFTIGTGKKCPFTWMMQNTDRLYADVAAYLKPYQEGTKGEPVPVPTPVPVPPKYADPLPIPELAAVADTDHDTHAAIVTREADEFIFVGDRVEATQDTPRLQYANLKAPHVGPVLKKGEQFDVAYLVKAADGEWYYVTDFWTRIYRDHTKRVSDTPKGSAVS